ncbi:MAG: redoxin domain-containing protein [Chloroflexi bacterium]|nr:redoxin domain-containing protein [Chloroflexota bacterium]
MSRPASSSSFHAKDGSSPPADTPPTRRKMTPRIGKPAPDFVLKSHTGGKVRLSSYQGRNVVLVFFPLAWTPV